MIKDWWHNHVLREWLFVRRALDEAYETGINETLNKRIEELAEYKLNDLLSPVDLRKIVKTDKEKGVVFIGDERVDEGRLSNLKAEAEFFKESDLWHLLSETPKELAQRAMFVTSESLVDLQKGKSILYTLSVQKNIVDIFLSYQKPGEIPKKINML